MELAGLEPATSWVRWPKHRLARTFDSLKDAAAVGDAALSRPVAAGDHLAGFDRGILLRASNALKSARLLLDNMHWEFRLNLQLSPEARTGL